MSIKFNPETDILPLSEAKAHINERIEANKKLRLAAIDKCKREALCELNNTFLNGGTAAEFSFNPHNCPDRKGAITIANELKERFAETGYKVYAFDYAESNKEKYAVIEVMVM